MSLIWLLLISLVVSLALFRVKEYVPSKWSKLITDMSLADAVTIIGVVFGVLVLFSMEPQFVRIQKTEDIRLGPFESKQWLTTRPGFDDSTLTPFYVRGIVVNDGDKVGMSYAVEFSLPRISWRGGLYRPYSAFVVAGDKPLFPQLSSLDWYHSYPHDGANIEYGDKWPRVEIPPVAPAGQVGLIIGLPKLSATELTNNAVINSLSKPLTIRLLKLRKVPPFCQVVDSLQITIDTIKYHDAML